jgi:hypothetical protein
MQIFLEMLHVSCCVCVAKVQKNKNCNTNVKSYEILTIHDFFSFSNILIGFLKNQKYQKTSQPLDPSSETLQP